MKYDKISKSSNPKDAFGSIKIPLHLWPLTATVMGCMGFLDGALKYGRTNYRPMGVKASTYFDACSRHLALWFEGEDIDPESGLPHLAHALACLAIIVDSQATGNLNDDRVYAGGYRKLVNEMTPHVARLKELHKHRSPKHYSIQDSIKNLKGITCQTTRRRKSSALDLSTARPASGRRSRGSPARSAVRRSKPAAASSSVRDRAAATTSPARISAEHRMT